MFAELSLLDSGLTAHTIGDTVAELMGTVARDNLHNLWQATQNKFTHAHPLSQHALGQDKEVNVVQFYTPLGEVIDKFYGS